jgi:hypothetical protein
LSEYLHRHLPDATLNPRRFIVAPLAIIRLSSESCQVNSPKPLRGFDEIRSAHGFGRGVRHPARLFCHAADQYPPRSSASLAVSIE